ncbi:sugar phosphate isomerase/epimerase family protein [Paenibacillus piri]|uniref:Sugar phosphate isomerase/epimerase n=1 Tax=Paenibacillus piri TaxID=2547395 RepID=A0A4R5KX82_9BACL|nr:TIM barrel protein [Paenibacillus piri]TDF99657.1 sugar phosphate isomerase/epimerase [Paenibacillus piri]
MKLGMPTLVEFRTVDQNVRLCHELGLDFIELNMNLPICLPEYLDSRQIRQLGEDYAIGFSVHLPEELDLSSFHPSIRHGHLERCKQTIDWAGEAGVAIVNMHLNNGIYFTLPDRKVWINDRYQPDFLQYLLESYASLYAYADSAGVQICIENAGNFHLSFIGEALGKLSSFARFGLTWDVGHDAKADYKETAVLMRHRQAIRHMHLHDYNGISDHQPLFSGDVPILDRLQFAQVHGLSVVIEMKTSDSLEQSVRLIRNRMMPGDEGEAGDGHRISDQ